MSRAPQYRVQVSERTGLYSNPFRRGGQAVRWSSWVTVLHTPHDAQAQAEYDRILPELFRRVRVLLGTAVVLEASQWGNRPKRLRKRRS